MMVKDTSLRVIQKIEQVGVSLGKKKVMRLFSAKSLMVITLVMVTGVIILLSIQTEPISEEIKNTTATIDKEKTTPKKFTEGNMYPHEWMYNQRAFPDNYINRDAIKQAITQSRQAIATRSSSQMASWTPAGPLNTGGRVTDVAISPESDDIMYLTTAVGGVFKTENGGLDWTPIFDEIGKPSIGNIAIAPSDPQRIYVGTGEANGSATSGAFYGDGIYRSDDAGATWTNIGLDGTDHIGRIVIDPTDPDVVFAAATGTLYDTNDERGIYRTTDGGTNWEQVLFISESTAAIDLVINPANPDILYAAMWERTRAPWQRNYGGLTSAIHRSTDGGDTWTELGAGNGLPAPSEETGRIGLAISASTPSTIYARFTTNRITNEYNGLYRSDDDGENWVLVDLDELIGIDSSFGWYFGNVRVNPNDASQIYVLGQRLFRSTDTGANWENVLGMHVDHHAMEFSTNNPNFILAGNDGGAYTSTDGGSTWIKFVNLPITQFYNIEVDFQEPQKLYGGTQDNNTIRTVDAGLSNWNAVWGGDGFHVNVDPNDNNFIYVESQFGNLGRSTDGGETFSSAINGIESGDRNNWNTPVVLSNFDSGIVYFGTQRLYRSTRAEEWSPISEDLTEGQHPSGAQSYGTLTAIAPSHNNLDVVYTGSDDGVVSVTFDGGTTWNRISDALPERYVTSIAISPSNDMKAYVTFSGYNRVDYTPHVFVTEDGGTNWTDISSNLPSIPVNDIIINENEDTLFLATDLNVWFSEDDGATWEILGEDLPLTIIRDLKLHEPTETLYAGTFGRSIYSYDVNGLIILGVEDEEVLANSVSMYPNPATENVTITAPFTEATITLYDLTGKMIQQLHRGSFNRSQSFSTSGFSKGIYFVSVVSEGKKVTKKLVIE